MSGSPSEENVDDVPIAEQPTDTDPEVIQFNYTWVIKKFSLDEKYKSPVFSPECNQKLKWYLKLSDSEEIEPSLCLMPCTVSDMTVKYRLTLRSNDKGDGNVMSMTIPPTLKKGPSKEVTEYGAGNSLSGVDVTRIGDTGRNVFAGKDLTIFCVIDVFIHGLTIPEYRGISLEPSPHKDIVEYLLNDEKPNDVTFIVFGQEFPARKDILAVRSNVFSAMFEDEMADKQENRVNVTDVEPEVFREMLAFLYTGQVPNIDRMADKLFMVAEKYEIYELKARCAAALCANLTIENSAETLITGDIYDVETLKSFTAVFINFNLAEVLETEGFQSLIKSNPAVMADVLRAVAETKRCGTVHE